jgi:ribonuclease D
LAQKCLGKEISKFEQCGAWDRRPLRNAQKHYAALDAVLPYKLVKLM